MKSLIAIILLLMLTSFNQSSYSKKSYHQAHTYITIGTLEKYDDALDAIVSAGKKAEIIADSLKWSEGPLWIEQYNMLLFSEVRTNTIYKWTEARGKEIYLKPSGYTALEPSKCKEPGSNGLTLDAQENLILCQHGNRQMAKMDAPLNKPEAKFVTLANNYNGKRFSSPNDCVYSKHGELYFTDPPYGLFTQDDNDKAKEIPFNGVYKIDKNGKVVLLIDSISRPNGLAFFPNQKKLLIANSDPNKPVWYIYDVTDKGLKNGKIFFDASGYDKSWRGSPDGLKIDGKGNVYAAGPGGIYFFNSQGKKLGMLRLENSASNCALSADEKTLYITNDMNVLRLKLK